ncbi:MAG: prepilin-type N-terminal cleavage/methylation domain-containing protein [Eubacteriaceae bacterium]|nr:prepilin-type N-terminal cleavage/methylation domain-containing protein [Eubacteriaceae bacterium]
MNRVNVKRERAGGFTLIEVVVVLVILAVTAAILIPSFSAYIEKSREKATISEARVCVVSAQTYASENYGTDSSVGDSATAAEISSIADLAETDGMISSIAFKSSQVQKLIYTSKNKITVIYENGKYKVASSGTGGWSDFSGLNADASTFADAENNLNTLAGLFSAFLEENLPDGACLLSNTAINLGNSGNSSDLTVYDSSNNKIGTLSASDFKSKMNAAGFTAGTLYVHMKKSRGNGTTPAYYEIKKSSSIVGGYYTGTQTVYFDPASGKIITKAETLNLVD